MKREMLAYAILVSDPEHNNSSDSLLVEIKKQAETADGWEPTGGPIVINTPKGNRLMQAMVRYKY